MCRFFAFFAPPPVHRLFACSFTRLDRHILATLFAFPAICSVIVELPVEADWYAMLRTDGNAGLVYSAIGMPWGDAELQAGVCQWWHASCSQQGVRTIKLSSSPGARCTWLWAGKCPLSRHQRSRANTSSEWRLRAACNADTSFKFRLKRRGSGGSA